MAEVKFVISESGVITALVGEKAYFIAPDAPYYEQFRKAVRTKDSREVDKVDAAILLSKLCALYGEET